MRAISVPTEPPRAEHRDLLREIEMLRSAADLVGNAPTDELAPNVVPARVHLTRVIEIGRKRALLEANRSS